MGIRYRSGYKYQLASQHRVTISIRPRNDIITKFIELDRKGRLLVKGGYAWDGPSGPVRDTPDSMRGSLVHDALYQLMRQRRISKKRWRDEADFELKRICLADGMSKRRANRLYNGVRLFGDPNASPKNQKKIHTAP